jgi:hypothetical protein
MLVIERTRQTRHTLRAFLKILFRGYLFYIVPAWSHAHSTTISYFLSYSDFLLPSSLSSLLKFSSDVQVFVPALPSKLTL